MAQLSSGSGPGEFLSTHPGHDTRIQQLNKWMYEAMAIYQSETQRAADQLPAIMGQQ